jgi:protein-disulfide isomerase
VPLLEQVLETYPGKVKIAFKNFPLRNHKNATKAAAAALAADRQGQFWQFHDMLFKNHKNLNEKMIDDFAVVLKLDLQAFEKAKTAPEVMNQIRQDVADGQKAGVQGTPVVFVNGKMLRERTLNGFKEIIDAELKKAAAQ